MAFFRLSFLLSFILFSFLVFPAYAEIDNQAKFVIALDYQMLANNYGDYSKNSVLFSSENRSRTIEFKGGKEGVGGLSLEYVFNSEEETKVRFSFRSTALTGQENSNGANLTDRTELGLDQTDSKLISGAVFYKRWVFDVLYEDLSIGKVKYLNVATDLDGNTGQILGTYNLVVERYHVSGHYHFGTFPFYMGLRGYQQKVPRMPHRYQSGDYVESGPLQLITYRSLNVSMELGEGDLGHDYNEAGWKWSMNFSMGLGEYSFEKASGVKDQESSSSFVIAGAVGYQWLFKLWNKRFFLRTDNRFIIHSFDNNDGNADALEGEINRTSGNDEEYRALIQIGMRYL